MSELLHVPSLVIAASVTGACVSAGHLLVWRAVRSEVGVLIWGIAYGLATMAMVMLGLRGHIPAFWSITVSNAMLLLASGQIWLGYRRFFGKVAGLDRFLALLGPLVWLALACDQELFADFNFRTHAISAMQFLYLLTLGFELVRQCRKECLQALVLTIALIVFQETMLVSRTVYLFFYPLNSTGMTLPNGTLIGLTLIGSMAVLVFSGLLQLALVARRSEQRFRIAAETDELTGLANRRRFLNEVLPRLATRPANSALILFDLDHFKHINDTYGHLTGDRALVAFAQILVKAAPRDAQTARVGGEEFALFLPDENMATAAALAERVRLLTQGYRMENGKGDLRLTVSGGIASVAEVGTDYETLHSAADAALYIAKSEGRNRVALHRPDPARPYLAFSRTDDRSSRPTSAAV